MRNVFLIVACMFMSIICASAQEYVVREVTGTVMIVKGKKKTAVKRGMKLDKSSVLEIGGGASLLIADTAPGGKTYKFVDKGQRPVGKHLSSNYPEINVLTKGYFSEVFGNVASAKVAGSRDSWATATGHRDMDSVFSEPAYCDSIATDTIKNPM